MPIYQTCPTVYRQTDIFTTVGVGQTTETGLTGVSKFTIQVSLIGQALFWSTDLEISLDGINFDRVLTHNNDFGANTMIYSNLETPSLYFRVCCTSLSPASSIQTTVTGSN